MNMNHTKHVTIGVCPFFSLSVTKAIHDRRMRDAANARRRAYVARITGFASICNFALALWKKIV